MKLSEENLSRWVSVGDIKEETGLDINLLITGLSKSAAVSPDKECVIRLEDLKEFLALAQKLSESLSEALPNPEEKKQKGAPRKNSRPIGFLSGKQFAEKAGISYEAVVELIESGALPAKKFLKGWRIAEEQLKRVPQLLKTSSGQQGGVLPGSKGENSGSGQNVDKDVGKGGDPNQKAGAGGTQTAGAISGKNIAPGPGDPLEKPIRLKVRSDGSCLVGDVALDTKVSVLTVQKWIKDKAVKTDANGNINTESLRKFLIDQGRATSITLEQKKGMPSI